MIRFLCAAIVVGLLPAFAAPLQAQDNWPKPQAISPKAVTQIGTLKARELKETSGFARSQFANNRLWTFNDGGNPAELFAIDLTGQLMAKLAVEGAQNIDWEAISSFRTQDAAYLLIADIGDNGAERAFYTLYVVKEPTLEHTGEKIHVEWVIHFVYEDGPQDAEALAIDESNETVMIVSKRKTPAAVYELPLQPANNIKVPAVAKRVAAIPYLLGPTMGELLFSPNRIRFSGKPTDLAISPNGSNAVLLTYSHAYWIRRQPQENWGAALHRLADYLPLPDSLAQAESIVYTFDGKAVLVTSEGRNQPLFRLDLPLLE